MPNHDVTEKLKQSAAPYSLDLRRKVVHACQCSGQSQQAVAVLYPIVARAFGLDATHAGIFLGGSIRDVAQLVGAGYSMSTATGDTATVVKPMRVAMLMPVIAPTVALMRAPADNAEGTGSAHHRRPPLLPWFVVVFAGIVLVNSVGWVPRPLAQAGNSLSGWCLVVSIAAIGVKTQVKELASIGIKPILLMVGETLLIAALVLGLLRTYG